MKAITPFEDRVWPAEWCRNCDRRINIGFEVSDKLWAAVVGDFNVCWCLTCFDEEAQRKEVRYSIDKENLFNVSWSDFENDPDVPFQMAGRTRVSRLMLKNTQLLSGENLDLSGLEDADQEFLKQLYEKVSKYPDYFDLLRQVKGPGAYPLRGGRITPEIAVSVLYRAAHDIVDRVGIEQGYLLPPDLDRS